MDLGLPVRKAVCHPGRAACLPLQDGPPPLHARYLPAVLRLGIMRSVLLFPRPHGDSISGNLRE
jgi:hypothetical protein